jgi:hypothetical protein
MSSTKNDNAPDYPAVNPDKGVTDPNPGNLDTMPEGYDGPSNVDVPADPASHTAKIAAEENPANKHVDDGEPRSEVAKAGFSERPDGSDNPARIKPADQHSAGNVKPAPKGKTLGQEMDESDKRKK